MSSVRGKRESKAHAAEFDARRRARAGAPEREWKGVRAVCGRAKREVGEGSGVFALAHPFPLVK